MLRVRNIKLKVAFAEQLSIIQLQCTLFLIPNCLEMSCISRMSKRFVGLFYDIQVSSKFSLQSL